MKILKRSIIVLIGIILLVQLPFIYRRYSTAKLAEQIANAEQKRTLNPDPDFADFKGIIHAHTNLGGHSTGSFDELIEAANTNGLDFVLMTEHYAKNYDSSALTLNGQYGKTLFVGGHELVSIVGDRFLTLPGAADAVSLHELSTTAMLEQLHARGSIALMAYPEDFKSWGADIDGVEVFSMNTAAKQSNPFTMPLDLLWSSRANIGLTFAGHFRRADQNLKAYDEASQKRRMTLFGGTDAHSNLGFFLFGDDAGHKNLYLKFDRYETIFSVMRMHVLLDKSKSLTRENLLESVRGGRSFTGVDVLGDTTGFTFVTNGGGPVRTMGDEAVFSPELKLRVVSPQPANLVIYKNGVRFREENSSNGFEFAPDGPGVYRVEAYLSGLSAACSSIPWVMTNPIYVR